MSWLAPRKDADGNPQLGGDGNQLYTDKRYQIFSLRLRVGAIEFYHLLDDDTKMITKAFGMHLRNNI